MIIITKRGLKACFIMVVAGFVLVLATRFLPVHQSVANFIQCVGLCFMLIGGGLIFLTD